MHGLGRHPDGTSKARSRHGRRDAAESKERGHYVLAMDARLTHMGPTGAGQTSKLCNQVIVR